MTYITDGKQNDLRLIITSSNIERAHFGIQISDLSIYKVNFSFHLTDFPFVYHGQSVFFFPILFPYRSDFLDHCPGSSFPNLPILPRIVLLSTLDLITTTTTTTRTKLKLKSSLGKWDYSKESIIWMACPSPASFVNMCWAQMFKFARSVFQMLIGNI